MTSTSPFDHPVPPDFPVDRDRMEQLVRDHWDLNRTAVNPETDQLVSRLSKMLDADVLEVESGAETLTWRVPKRWNVRKGELRTVDGDVLADYRDNPLHLWTHSVPQSGMVDRETLLEDHVHTDPNRPQEIPYHYRNGFRYDAEDWGFSIPHATVQEMDDDEYVVDIDTDLDEEGTLKVVDAHLPGRRDETIFFAAHTCHPAQVSDGLANVAVAVELYHLLKNVDERRYSYRFLFGPEYFGGAAYLSEADQEAVEDLRYGLYLDFLSSYEPIGFQHSMQGDARIDRIVSNVLESHTEAHVVEPYRELVGNDETFYNGPGFEIPTVGLARSVHREYHYSSDNPSSMSLYKMEEAVWILRRVVEVVETDFVPVRQWDGPLYLSRYDLYVDPAEDRDASRSLERLHTMTDGTRSCFDMAHELDLDFFQVRDHFRDLADKGLVETRPRDDRPEDLGTIDGG